MYYLAMLKNNILGLRPMVIKVEQDGETLDPLSSTVFPISCPALVAHLPLDLPRIYYGQSDLFPHKRPFCLRCSRRSNGLPVCFLVPLLPLSLLFITWVY